MFCRLDRFQRLPFPIESSFLSGISGSGDGQFYVRQLLVHLTRVGRLSVRQLLVHLTRVGRLSVRQPLVHITGVGWLYFHYLSSFSFQ
ncbi:unnamed protein product [Arabidopsis halleri]